MTADISTHRHRHRRRSHRRIRVVALIVAALSLVMGLAMLAWAASEANATHRLIGFSYLGVTGLSLVVYAAAARANPLRLLRARESSPGARRLARSGMALLMVLLLVALLSGALLQGMVSARQQMRLVEWQRDGILLRAAAMDAALGVLRAAAAGRALPTAAPAEARLPSGIVTRVGAASVDRQALPAALRRLEAPAFGKCFELTAEASQAGRSRRVRGLASQAPGGDVRVLAWVESL